MEDDFEEEESIFASTGCYGASCGQSCQPAIHHQHLLLGEYEPECHTAYCGQNGHGCPDSYSEAYTSTHWDDGADQYGSFWHYDLPTHVVERSHSPAPVVQRYHSPRPPVVQRYHSPAPVAERYYSPAPVVERPSV